VNVVQRRDRLDLDDDTSLDQEIGDKVTHENILVTNFDPVLLRNMDSSLPEFYSERVLVNFFEKSRAKNIAHLMYATDDFFLLFDLALIGVHRRPSAA